MRRRYDFNSVLSITVETGNVDELSWIIMTRVGTSLLGRLAAWALWSGPNAVIPRSPAAINGVCLKASMIRLFHKIWPSELACLLDHKVTPSMAHQSLSCLIICSEPKCRYESISSSKSQKDIAKRHSKKPQARQWRWTGFVRPGDSSRERHCVNRLSMRGASTRSTARFALGQKSPSLCFRFRTFVGKCNVRCLQGLCS